jgi:DNA-binding transcriptional ArsR family regulator
MNIDPDIARLAALVTEPARAAIMTHLLDGRSWTATELARAAGVRAPTASAHLKKLVAGELIKVSPNGRHRYFRLASTQVARLVEQLQGFAPLPVATTPGQRRASAALSTCRLCYDHLAGRLGVEITLVMIRRGWLFEDEPWFRLTDLGREALAELGVAATTGRTCMDWSERRLHLAGPLGAQLAQVLMSRKILLRDSKTRALRVAPLGAEWLSTRLGISLENQVTPSHSVMSPVTVGIRGPVSS